MTNNNTDCSPYPDWHTEDDVDHSWYADTFLDFIVMILWDSYPKIRPTIMSARNACWKIWQSEAREYFNTNSVDTIHKPISMMTQGITYSSVVRYYFKNLDKKVDDLIRGLFDGSFCDISKG